MLNFYKDTPFNVEPIQLNLDFDPYEMRACDTKDEQSAIVIFLPTGHVLMLDNCKPGGYGESLGIITDERPCACPPGTCNEHWHEYENFEE